VLPVVEILKHTDSAVVTIIGLLKILFYQIVLPMIATNSLLDQPNCPLALDSPRILRPVAISRNVAESAEGEVVVRIVAVDGDRLQLMTDPLFVH
jgi:hypothetical protein